MKTLILIPALLYAGFIFSTEQDNATQAYQKAYAHVLERNWEQASTAFRSYLNTFERGNQRDGAQFWLCYSGMQKTDNPEQDFSCFESFLESYPESRWTEDARSNLVRLAYTLADGGNQQYLGRVSEYEQSDNEKVLMAAITALGMRPNQNISHLRAIYEQQSSEKIRRQVVHALMGNPSDEAQNFLLEIYDREQNENIRNVALAGVVQRMTPETVEFLKERFSELDNHAKFMVMDAMARTSPDETFSFLRDEILNTTDNQRLMAYFTILAGTYSERPEAVQLMSDIYFKSESSSVKIGVLVQLRDAPLELYEPVLRDALRSDDHGLLHTAIKLISFSGDANLMQEVRAMLSSDMPEQALITVIVALDSVKDAEVRREMYELVLHHESQSVRRTALQRWIESGEVTTADIRRIIENSDKWVELSPILFVKLDEMDDLSWFRTHFSEIPESQKRIQVLTSLGSWADDSASAAGFLDWVARNDHSGQVRQRAVMMLGHSGSEEAQHLLLKLIEEGQIER